MGLSRFQIILYIIGSSTVNIHHVHVHLAPIIGISATVINVSAKGLQLFGSEKEVN
jgi:hypothetical protein